MILKSELCEKRKKTSEIKSSQKLRQLVRYAQRRMPQILYKYPLGSIIGQIEKTVIDEKCR